MHPRRPSPDLETEHVSNTLLDTIEEVPIVLVVAADLRNAPAERENRRTTRHRDPFERAVHHFDRATMFLGWPQHRPTRLTRRAVAEFTTVDRFDCGTFEPDAQA